jgi:hypothetical protein
MSTQEYITKLRERVNILQNGNAIGIAAQDTHVQMVERIFEQGKNAQDSEIGSYDPSNPLYVNPKNAPKKFPTKGKDGDSKFENGEPHKTGYFESYKAYRQAVGRQTGSVDLVLFGNLQSDFGKAVVRKEGTSWASTVTRVESRNKIAGIEGKYGNVFRLTPNERDNFKQVLASETYEILK